MHDIAAQPPGSPPGWLSLRSCSASTSTPGQVFGLQLGRRNPADARSGRADVLVVDVPHQLSPLDGPTITEANRRSPRRGQHAIKLAAPACLRRARLDIFAILTEEIEIDDC